MYLNLRLVPSGLYPQWERSPTIDNRRGGRSECVRLTTEDPHSNPLPLRLFFIFSVALFFLYLVYVYEYTLLVAHSAYSIYVYKVSFGFRVCVIFTVFCLSYLDVICVCFLVDFFLVRC